MRVLYTATVVLTTLLVITMNKPCNMLIIGHRGASAYAPENTLASFEKAIELGVPMVELDVFSCKTGELVVIHDNDLSRTTNGTGLVTEETLASLRKLDAGNGQQIPTLNEVFDLVNKRAIINVELKGHDCARPLAHLIMEYITIKGWTPIDFLVSSFDQQQLALFASLLPQVPIGVLIYGIPIDYAACAETLGAVSIHINHDVITEAFVHDVHQRGLKCYAYTINDPKDFERLVSLGVDGIFTDAPDLFL